MHKRGRGWGVSTPPPQAGEKCIGWVEKIEKKERKGEKSGKNRKNQAKIEKIRGK